MRLNSKEERSEILLLLTKRLMDTKCEDIEILTQVDRLCRRSWIDIARGWVRWSYYLENLIGMDEYSDLASSNCRRIDK